MNKTTVNILDHTISGDYIVPSPLPRHTNLSAIPGDIGIFLYILQRVGYDPAPYVITGRSDLVVSLDSQFGGLSSEATSKFEHQHTEATTQEVANNVINLLNVDSDSSSFNKGFPIR